MAIVNPHNKSPSITIDKDGDKSSQKYFDKETLREILQNYEVGEA